jgi:hypothetical protein
MDTPIPQSLAEAFDSIEHILSATLNRQLALHIACVPPSWMILYDTHELKAFFYDLMTMFPALWPGHRKYPWRGRLNITFKAEEHHVVIHIALWNGLITSREWDKFFNEFREQPCYEYLRELGGDIEPLAWDEGQGQGVIVRLPWAKATL